MASKCIQGMVVWVHPEDLVLKALDLIFDSY